MRRQSQHRPHKLCACLLPLCKLHFSRVNQPLCSMQNSRLMQLCSSLAYTAQVQGAHARLVVQHNIQL